MSRSFFSLLIALFLTTNLALLAQSTIVNCSSENGSRRVCPIGRNNGVRLVNRRSGSQCIQGRTWGQSGNQIWVDRGCRADFEVFGYSNPGGGNGGIGPGQGSTIRCDSSNGYKRCQVPGNIVRANLVRQISGSPCTAGRTWGYDPTGIWVDRGCRAEFRYFMQGGGNGGYPGPPRTVTCSAGVVKQYCVTGTFNNAYLERVLGGVCTRNWGVDQKGLWVALGCRAQFVLQ